VINRWWGVAALGAAVVLAGCQTPGDRWLADHLSPREKSTLMVDKGLATLEQVADEGDLSLIPSVQAAFRAALSVDPTDPRIIEAQKKLDTYLAKRRTEGQARLKVLTDKASLTDKEKYTLVVLVRQLELLAPPGLDLSKVSAQTAPIRAEVLRKATLAVTDAEKTLAAAKTETLVAKALSRVYKAIGDLRQLDAKNPDAEAAAGRLSTELNRRAKVWLDAGKKAWLARDYQGAIRSLDRIDQVLTGAGYQPTAQADEVRYGASLDWARALYNDKKYGEAGTRINDALAVEATPDALDLREKIIQAASVRDWDAEYDALDRQLDSLIKAGELKTAWSLAASTSARLKKDDTKAQLAARRRQILDAAHDVYDASIASYNDEDYGDAKSGFDLVAAIDPGWKLTRAYQDKARARLQLLEGR
jgi:hypothetical protein